MIKTNLKYFNSKVVFREVPNEVTLAINISGCPIKCPGCHSKFLWDNLGVTLTEEELKWLICDNEGISCVCFMGGDQSPKDIIELAKVINQYFPTLKVAWYSGRDTIAKEVSKNLEYFDYIKYGPYIASKGPLNNPNTNQVMIAKGKNLKKMSTYPNEWYDITERFWRKDNGSKNKEA